MLYICVLILFFSFVLYVLKLRVYLEVPALIRENFKICELKCVLLPLFLAMTEHLVTYVCGDPISCSLAIFTTMLVSVC